MPGYYVYTKGDDGRIKDRVTITCDDDEKAKAHAEGLVDGYAVELWQEGRKIAEFSPRSEDANRPRLDVHR